MADITTLPKLQIKAYRDGYNFKLGRNTTSTETEAGPVRQRKTSIGKPHTLTATFKCTRPMWQYLDAFLLAYEAKPFLAYLLIEGVEHKWYECRCLDDDGLQVSTLGDQIFTANVRLQATPTGRNAQSALALVKIYDANNAQPQVFTDLLEQIVNVEMPEALGDGNR